MVQALGVVLPGGGVGVFFLLIDLAGGDAVAEHFHHVVDRNLHAPHLIAQLRRVVDPVFKMVPVPPLVVEPGGGIALLQPFDLVGAAGPLVVPDACEELDGGVFAHVVEQALPVQAGLETVFHDPQLVGGDGSEMSK